MPAGDGTLVELSGGVSEDCLSEFRFSDANGNSLSVGFGSGSADDGGDDGSDDGADDGGDDGGEDCDSDVCLSLDGGDLNYSSTEDIAGFQFSHNGCVTGAGGGDAAANGFTVSASGSAVLGFSFTGSVVPAGDGTLVELSGDVSEDCLSDFISLMPLMALNFLLDLEVALLMMVELILVKTQMHVISVKRVIVNMLKSTLIVMVTVL